MNATANAFCCAAMVFCVLAAVGETGTASLKPRIDRSKLLIGAYCLQSNARTDAHVKAIRDCGVDFIIGVPASDRATLDLFAKHGVGAIVNGVVPGWWGGDGERAGKMREINPIEKYTAAAASFKDHPAIWAVDIGDEPSALDFPYYGEVVRQLNKALPGMPLYLNLYPNYASVAENSGKQTVNQLGTKTYAEHIAAYCRDVPLDYISYDFYVYTGPSDIDRFISKMYDNFIDVSGPCRRMNRSFWYIPQVNSRKGLPYTSENQLRFQAYAAMSFGAEAITWACWCKGWWINNVLDDAGQQTPQYAKLQKINAELKRLGPEYMKFRTVATHFVGFPEKSKRNPALAFNRCDALDVGPFSGLRASNGAPLLVGEMVARSSTLFAKALFVTAADDPCDQNQKDFEVVFKSASAIAFDGNGKVEVKRRDNGLFSVPISSCRGLLLVSGLYQ